MIDYKVGTTGPALVFVPGNGYAPGAYRQLLELLAQTYQVHGVALRPLHDEPVSTGDWQELADDVGSVVDRTFSGPVFAVGHSIGAVTLLLSAANRPECYARLVLIEPVALPAWATVVLKYGPVGLRRRGPLAMGARRRRDRWTDYDEAYAAERRRRSLARVSDDVLRDIIDSSIVPHPESGVTLRFTKEWEARLYESPPNIWAVLRRRLPPVTVVWGNESKVLRRKTVNRWHARRPDHDFVEIARAGHLLPLERPEETARCVLARLALPDAVA